MAQRLKLQTLLSTFGAKKVYFQAPGSSAMEYPCIVYSHDNSVHEHADNRPYRITKRWQITVIDPDPDSKIPDKVAALPMATFQRAFAKEQLNHTIYSVYF